MLHIYLGTTEIFSQPNTTDGCTISNIKQTLYRIRGINQQDVYFVHNGKLAHNESRFECGNIYVIPKLFGGKGGFGSMLRAIGAQIEKTTNREACRDLSGRRLRDINEEKRLKTWIAQQVEREKEATERRQKKLEKLCEMPKHEFHDELYDKERSDLPEKVEDAVLQGLKAADSKQVAEKRKQPEETSVKKKKPKLWVDSDVDELSSSDESDAEPIKQDNIDEGESSAGGTSKDKVQKIMIMK